MSYKTLEDVVLLVHSKLRLVPGTAVQVYNEDYTGSLVLESYYAIAREPGFWWHQFMDWTTITPDGVTGKPITDFNSSDKPWQIRHEDIRAVFPLNDNRQLSVWSGEYNPSFVAYTRPYVDFIGDGVKLLRILPITSTEQFTVHRRLIPQVETPEDILLIDDDVLSNKVAWRLATGDGSNPSNGMLFLNLFEAAFNRMKSGVGNMPRELDPMSGEYPTNWYQVP